jgi:PAS domain S-box-containing protein
MAQVPLARVLIVESRQGERLSKTSVLRRAGLSVIEADDDASAVKELQEHFSTINAVVLGMNLADAPTQELCRWIGQHCPGIPVMRPSGTAVDAVAAFNQSTSPSSVDLPQEAEFVSQVQALLRMRNAEQALQNSKDAERQALVELAAIYDKAPVGLAVISADKRFLRINARLAEINGIPVIDHIGRTIREVVPALAAQTEALVDRILETGEAILDLEIEGATAAQPGVTRIWREHWQPVKNATGEVTAVNVVVEDITDTKRQEQQLRESEHRLRAILDALPVGVCVTNTNSKVTLSNAKFCQYEPEDSPSHDVENRSRWEAYDAEGRRIAPENHPGARALRGETVVPGVDFLFHPPGADPLWTRVSAVPLRDECGAIAGEITVVADIDRMWRALESIRESEWRYRQLFEANPQPMFIFDTETLEFLRVNRAALDLYGYTREEFSRLTMETIRPEEDVARFRQQLASRGGEILVRDAGWRHRRKDGTVFEVEASSHRLDFDGRPARFVMVHDVTDRRRAEESLLRSEMRLRLAMEASSIGIWEWDVKRETITWSPECYAILGLKPKEFDGTGQSINHMLHPEDRQRVQQLIHEALRHNSRFAAEFRMFRADGEVRWLSTTGRTAYDREGLPGHMLGTMTDITERKRAEEHNRLLMHEVNHRSKNLLSVVQSIASQTASKGNPATFALRLSERLRGLSVNHDLLVENKWRGVDLADLVAAQTSPFRSALSDRIRCEGPDLRVNSAAAQTLGLALHELATNAAKYGSLSSADGSVNISWQVDRATLPHMFRMQWAEVGGPEVRAPRRKGFGTVLLEDLVKTSLKGKVQLDYAPSGLVWSVEVPLENILGDGGGPGSA